LESQSARETRMEEDSTRVVMHDENLDYLQIIKCQVDEFLAGTTM